MITERNIITLADFKRVDITQGLYYLKADVGSFEITIEPHLQAGYSIAIYAKRDPLLSIKKRAVWKFNHPSNRPPEMIQRQLLDSALSIAQDFYEIYVLKLTNDYDRQPTKIH